jgi:hypothetical protein
VKITIGTSLLKHPKTVLKRLKRLKGVRIIGSSALLPILICGCIGAAYLIGIQTAQTSASPVICTGTCSLSKSSRNTRSTPSAQAGASASSASRCTQAQRTYDKVSTQTINQTNTYASNAKQDDEASGMSTSATNSVLNQFYITANAELQQEYATYLETVDSIQGCTLQSQIPAYKLLTT